MIFVFEDVPLNFPRKIQEAKLNFEPDVNTSQLIGGNFIQ
jgi:hypothetical protein